MRAAFSEGCSCVTFYREAGDPKFYGTRFAKGEHSLVPLHCEVAERPRL